MQADPNAYNALATWPPQLSQSEQSSSGISHDGSDAGTCHNELGCQDLSWLDSMAQPLVPFEMERISMLEPTVCGQSDAIASGLQRVEALVTCLCEGSKCSLDELKLYSQTIAGDLDRHAQSMDLLKSINKTSSQILDVQVRTADHSAIAAEQRRQIYDRFQVIEHAQSSSTQLVSDALSVSNARIAQLEIQIAKVSIDVEQTRETVLMTLNSLRTAVEEIKHPKARARPPAQSRKRKRPSPPVEPLQSIIVPNQEDFEQPGVPNESRALQTPHTGSNC